MTTCACALRCLSMSSPPFRGYLSTVLSGAGRTHAATMGASPFLGLPWAEHGHHSKHAALASHACCRPVRLGKTGSAGHVGPHTASSCQSNMDVARYCNWGMRVLALTWS